MTSLKKHAKNSIGIDRRASVVPYVSRWAFVRPCTEFPVVCQHKTSNGWHRDTCMESGNGWHRDMRMESGTKFLIVTQLAVPLLRSVIHVPCLSTCLFFKLKRQKQCISTHNSFELGLIRLVCLHCLCTFQTPSFPHPFPPSYFGMYHDWFTSLLLTVIDCISYPCPVMFPVSFTPATPSAQTSAI